MRLGQTCSSHRTYISQACILDRRATLIGHTLTGHVSHGRSDLALTANLTQTVPRALRTAHLRDPFSTHPILYQKGAGGEATRRLKVAGMILDDKADFLEAGKLSVRPRLKDVNPASSAVSILFCRVHLLHYDARTRFLPE